MRSRALVMGFQGKGLVFTDRDIDLMTNCLNKHDYAVTTCNWTRKGELTDCIDEFLDSIDALDTVIFYFSGHGIIERGELFLIIGDDANKSAARLRVEDLARDIGNSLGKNKLLILDCCHAGGVSTEWRPDASDRYRILTASNQLERTKELDAYEASFLTFNINRALCDETALRELADKEHGDINLDALHKWLLRKTRDHNNICKPEDKVPEPGLLGNQAHDFAIARVKSNETVEPPPLNDFRADSVLLSRYLRGLIENNTLPALIHKSEKYGPPDTTEIYVDLSCTEDRLDVEEKELIEEQSSDEVRDEVDADAHFEEYAYGYARLPMEHLPPRPAEKTIAIYEKHRSFVLLGDPGSGKSTFLKYLTQHFVQVIQRDPIEFLTTNLGASVRAAYPLGENELTPVLLPIRIPIRYYADRRKADPSLSLEQFLPHHFMPHEKDAGELHKFANLLERLLKSGACVVLLDGLDEISHNDVRHAVAKEIGQFLYEYKQYQGNRFVITSRIPGFRYVQHELAAHCAIFRISPMSDQEVKALVAKRSDIIERRVNPSASLSTIRKVTDERVRGILERRKIDRSVRSMTSNPLLCGLIVSMYPDIPPTRAELYSKAIETLLSDWPRQRNTTLTLQKKQFEMILQDLGYWIHDEIGRRYISAKDIKNRFEDRLSRDLYKGISATADVLLADFLATTRETGIFEDRGGELFGFPHLGFEEYFAARWIHDWGTEEALRRVVDLMHIPRWNEVALMAVSMAPSMEIDNWLEQLRQKYDPYEDVLHRNLLFVADCIVEGANAGNKVQQNALMELFALYLDRSRRGRYSLLRAQVKDSITRFLGIVAITNIASALTTLATRTGRNDLRLVFLEIMPLLEPLFRRTEETSSVIYQPETDEEVEMLLSLVQEHYRTVPPQAEAQELSDFDWFFGALWILESTGPKWREALRLMFDVNDEESQEEIRRLAEGSSHLSDRPANAQVEYLVATCKRIGQKLLSCLRHRWSYHGIVRDAAAGLTGLDTAITYEQFERNVGGVAGQIENQIILQLQRTTDSRRYTEAVSILLALKDEMLNDRICSLVATHLGYKNKSRCAIAAVCSHVQILAMSSDVYMAMLQYSLEELTEDSPKALDSFGKVAIKGPLIDWYWRVLVNSEHPLHNKVIEQLSGVVTVDGNNDVLALLSRGMKSATIRPFASRLFRSVTTWTGNSVELLVSLVEMVYFETGEPRTLAAFHLGQKIVRDDGSLAPLVDTITGSEDLADLVSRIRTNVQVPSDDPDVRNRLDSELAEFGLSSSSSIAQMKEALTNSASRHLRVLLAYVLVISHDLLAAILEAMIDGVSDDDDEIRQSVESLLDAYVSVLPTDGSTKAIQVLLDSYYVADHSSNGYLTTLLSSAVQGVRYNTLHWPEKWFSELNSPDKPVRIRAQTSIANGIQIVNSGVLEYLVEHAITTDYPNRSRRLSVEAMVNTLGSTSVIQGPDLDPELASALQHCLKDQDAYIRGVVAWGLRKSRKGHLDDHIRLLSQYIGPQESSYVVRFVAMKSLGHLLWKYKVSFDSEHELAQSIIAELETYSNEDCHEAIWRGAAVGLANAYHGDAKRTERLMSLLQSDTQNVLEVLLLANAESDVWIYQSGRQATDTDDYFESELRDILSWIRGQDRPTLHNLVNFMFGILEKEAKNIGTRLEDEDDSLDPFSGWPLRRFTMIVLAELFDRFALAPSLLTKYRERAEIQKTLIDIGRDPNSFNVRRFAIRLLSEFETLNSDIAHLLFGGYKDTRVVIKDALDAANRFRDVTPESLDYLTGQLRSRSLICASTAAMLLGRLGVVVAQRHPETRDQIATTLFKVLTADPTGATRRHQTRPDSDECTFGDIVFESLLQVVSGQDFQRWEALAISHAALDALATDRRLPAINLEIDVSQTSSKSHTQGAPTSRLLQGLGNLDTLRRQAKDMQDALAAQEMHFHDNGIEIVMTGSQVFKSVTISGKIDDDLVECLNTAIKASQESAATKLQKMTGGLGGLLNNRGSSNQSATRNPLQVLGDLNSLRNQAKRMQEELAQEQITIENGDVIVTIAGDQRLLSVVISGQSHDHLLSVANEAIKKSQQVAAKMLQQMTGGLGGLLSQVQSGADTRSRA